GCMSVPKPRFKAAQFLFRGLAAREWIADNFIDLNKESPPDRAIRRAPGLAAREVSDGQIHPDSLGLGEIVERGGAVLATKAGVALAAPGQAHVGIAIGVHPDRARARPLGEALQLADVAAPDAGSEA